MATSPRDLRGGNGMLIRANHPLWPRTFRADVGIRPYAGGRFLPRNLARPMLSGVPSTPADKRAAPSPSRRGRGIPASGSAVEEGRYQVRPGTTPHPSGLRPATLSQERILLPYPSRLRRASLSVGEGGLRREKTFTPYLWSAPGTGSGTARRNFPRTRSCPCPAGPFRPSSSGW